MSKVKIGICSIVIYIFAVVLCISWLGSGEPYLIERGLCTLFIATTIFGFGLAFLWDKNRNDIKTRIKADLKYRSLNIVMGLLCIFVLFQVTSYEFSETGKKEREDMSVIYDIVISDLQNEAVLPKNVIELSKYFPNCFKGTMVVAIEFINMAESVAESLNDVVTGVTVEPQIQFRELPDVESKSSLFIYPIYLIRDYTLKSWNPQNLSECKDLMQWYISMTTFISVAYAIIYSMAFRGYVILVESLGTIVSYIVKRDKAE